MGDTNEYFIKELCDLINQMKADYNSLTRTDKETANMIDNYIDVLETSMMYYL